MMKKRNRSSRRRVISRRSSDRSSWFSRANDVYNPLKEKVFTREVIVILLVLIGGMIFFDALDYDYTGLVTSSLGSNSITGAPAGIPDSAIRSIGDSISSIFDLIFKGFLDPLLKVFGNNSIIATKLTLFVIVFFFILPVCKRIFKKGDEGGNERAATLVAALISILGVALLPSEVAERLSNAVPIFLIMGFLIGVLYGLHKWDADNKFESFLKGIFALGLVFILIYILEGLDSGMNESLSGAVWIIAGLGYLMLIWLFIDGVFIKTFGGASGELAERYNEVREDVTNARDTLETSRRARGETTAGREKLRSERRNLKGVNIAETATYNALKDVRGIITSRIGKKRLISKINKVINGLRRTSDSEINRWLSQLMAGVAEFERVCKGYTNAVELNDDTIREGKFALEMMKEALVNILQILEGR